MHPLTSVMLLHSTLVKALHGARKGRSQRVDLEALRLKVLLLGGAPGVVLLGTPELQCTKGFCVTWNPLPSMHQV